MTNSAGYSSYPGCLAPDGADEWYPWGRDHSTARVSRLGRSLSSVVAVLGAATFAVSFGSPVVLGFPVQLGVLAAIVAAVSLLPRQAARGWIIVALAVTGFLDTVVIWIRVDDPHWVLTLIMVLNALQALAAMGALLHESRVLSGAGVEGGPDYSAYEGFTQAYQAYQAYATQYLQSAPASYDVAGQATARAYTEASAPADLADARADTAQESFGALQARYNEYGDWASVQRSDGSRREPSAAPVAERDLPGARPVVPQDQSYRNERGGSEGLWQAE
jgi:hypothetical protein